jgi:RNA polymerase sigma-70 factor (ECF subfamily)
MTTWEGYDTDLALARQGRPALGDQAESDLVARAQRGEPAALDELYQRYRDQVFGLSLSLCADREEAHDLLQETFIRAFRGLPRFGGRSRLGTWLYRITVNTARDLERRRRRQDRPAPLPRTPDLVTVQRVRGVLAGLRWQYRAVLALRYSQELSYQEIADCLGWSLARTKVTLHRARLAFKDAYPRIEA